MIITKPSERYEVERELARGAFGVAYLARDTLVYWRRVVIKILFEAEGRTFDDISNEASFRTMFERETMALARIDHPRVVHIYEYGWTPEGKPFIVMQYVEGKTLRAAMGERAMGPERAAHIVSQLGSALTAVHDAGVVHRDLKPENVMLQTSYGDEFAILIDFGIAKVEVSRAGRSEQETWAGTPVYMAPEQLQGYPIPASDVWALGVVAYELVTGRRPFSAADILMLKDAPVTEPRALCPALPKVAQAVILKALSYDPAQRHTHAHEMGQEFLRAVLEGDPPVSAPVPISESPELIRRLAQEILVQTLGVSHKRDTAGREGLMYAPAPFGEMAPDSEYVPVKWQFLKKKIEDIRDRVEDLNRRALVGKKREGNGLEAVTRSLSDHVLPVSGFVGMLGSGIHPQFDLVQDAASLIPWELLEESRYVCPQCHKGTPPHRFLDKGSRYCALCGERLELTGGKLALTHHLTHLVRGGGRFGGEGKQFLFIEDPLGDLCSADKDPQGICAGHLSELRSMIEQQGYEIKLLEGKNATVNHVLSALDNDSLLGIYYFGHGFFPRDGDEGCLLLADEQLFASQIIEIGPAVRFVFLNSCEGAAAGRDWGLEKRENSVASAFARGRRSKVVIAPIWPVISVQAAETAMDFFQQALRAAPLGEALRTARTNSFQRYETGEPDISWGAYRYFGDPNRLLPVPSVAQAVVGPDVAVPASRVFDSDGELNAELFAFAIDQVLLRAAKRRNLQNRTLVSMTDLLAGMIRTGDLTRFVLRQTGINPDEIYEKIGSQAEAELGTNRKEAVDQTASELEATASIDQAHLDEAKLREILAKWIVCYEEQFAPELVVLLAKADVVSQNRDIQGDDSRITEKVILESLVADDSWARLSVLGLPSAKAVLRCLQAIIDRGDVDENGAINLAALDDSAKKIIETAHVLAQQRGIFPITNRLTLAAFIAEKEGYASRACRLAGERPSLLYAWLLAASKESVPASFGLSPEACERIVIPVIAAARKNTSQDDRITEGNLFRAFCEVADPGFKEFLKLPPFLVDLDKLRVFDPDEQKAPPETELVATKIDAQGPPLDDDASNMVIAAHTMARKIGVSPIPHRLMLAAFLIHSDTYTARLFKRHGIPADAVCAALIASAGGRFEEMVKAMEEDFRMPSESSDEGMAAILKRARQLSDNLGVITESMLFKSFCEIAVPAFKAWLKSSPVRIDLDALAADESE